ncbi:PilZ domain-containing protein [Sphaerotilus hippei]|uniref:PilZ domain-containing protein n=1 Tax=Sphaerotilus hippei TaxID=744406 RepID=A0A318H3D0_9BURK|nr:PilZ domain-containing protein [Sphaerotilus hippei]PXW97950.1 PilZ domain-containing protein [Sphaerotilus hippei]
MAYAAQNGPACLVELRDEQRRAIDAPPRNALYVKNRERQYPVHAVRDVSARGISVMLDQALTPGEAVLLESQRGLQHVEYCAFVVWCRSPPADVQALHKERRHLIGLRVYGPQALGHLIA